MQAIFSQQSFASTAPWQFPAAAVAGQLKQLERCARLARDPDHRMAAARQIDTAWRRILDGASGAEQALHRAAYVAGFMLGGILLPEDLQYARRHHRGLTMADPYPYCAASLYAMLDTLSSRQDAATMQDAFACMSLSTPSSGTAPGPWPSPPVGKHARL